MWNSIVLILIFFIFMLFLLFLILSYYYLVREVSA